MAEDPKESADLQVLEQKYNLELVFAKLWFIYFLGSTEGSSRSNKITE
jgi:hypothetical protein